MGSLKLSDFGALGTNSNVFKIDTWPPEAGSFLVESSNQKTRGEKNKTSYIRVIKASENYCKIIRRLQAKYV